MIELLPCPFCGGEGAITTGIAPRGVKTVDVVCQDCMATMPGFCEEDAVDWNRRASTPPASGVAQAAPRCARCGSSGDTYVLCSGCGMPASPPYPVEAVLRECASRCRYDGDLFHDQGNIERRDASWKAAEMAADALSLVSSTDRAAPPSVAPVAWRYRSKDEPKWEYSDKPLIPKDLFRMEPGFEEQPVYAAPPSVALDPTNHHNALKCPYCNPNGLVLTRPQPGGAVAGTDRGGIDNG